MPWERSVSWQSGGMTPIFFCRGEDFLAQVIPPLVKFAFVFIDPLFGHVMRGMRRTRRKIGEEWLVRRERLLLAYPLDRLVRRSSVR